MIRYFFQGIPSLLFEPVAVCALLALLTALVVFWKHHDRFYWIVAGTIFFMIVWRLGCHNEFFSTRYASILLYPAVILVAWLCFYLKELAEKQGFLPQSRRTLIPIFCAVLLSAICIGKILHFNPYDAHTVKISKVLKQEIAGKKFFLWASVDQGRIAYYAEIPPEKVQFWDGQWSSLKNILKEKRNYLEPLYFVFYLPRNLPEPDAEFLKLDSSRGQWKCIHREYTSRKKNKEMLLYRFVPTHPNVELWEKEIPPMSSDNLCLNGDFERALAGDELRRRIDYYKKIHASDFYVKEGRLFPQAWWLGVGAAVNGFSPQMSLTADQPIAGKYSLEMNGTTGLNSAFIAKQDCIFTGFIRAKKDSPVLIYSCYWDVKEKSTEFIDSINIYANLGKTYRFTLPVKAVQVPKEDREIYIIVQTGGHILLDQVEFIPSGKDQR